MIQLKMSAVSIGMIQSVERCEGRHDPVDDERCESRHDPVQTLRQSSLGECGLPSTCDLELWLATVWRKCGPVTTLFGIRSAIIWVCFVRFLPLTADSRKNKDNMHGVKHWGFRCPRVGHPSDIHFIVVIKRVGVPDVWAD